MNFKTMDELLLWVMSNERYHFDGGTQGECYKIGHKVFKIFTQYIEEDFYEMIEYNKEEILRFSSIKNNSYVWPKDIITVGDIAVGYIMDYANAKSLYKIDPLRVSLDAFEKRLEGVYPDIRIISDSGIRSFDVAYNILYGRCGFKIVDTMEYTKSDIDKRELYRINKENFDIGIKLFLTDDYFDEFLLCNNSLYNMYCDQDVDMILFLKEFRKKLSEKEGCEITKLGDAKKSVSFKKKKTAKYIRLFNR